MNAQLVPFRQDQHRPTPDDSLNSWIELVAPAAELAKTIAGTEFVPAEMRNKPAAITACILYGAEIGIGPMQALAKVDIVKGRPAPRAELARALALAAGHEVWVDESTNTRVTVSGKRRASDHVMTVTWTMDDAKRAGLSGGNYQKYPRQMLLARASAELVRQLCPDALGGITMFAEEADDAAFAESQPAPVAAEPVKATIRRRTPQAPAPAALEAATDEPIEPAATVGELANEMQIKKMIVCFNAISVKERDGRLNLIRLITGREVESSKDCTKDEASKVIDTLDRIAGGQLELQWIEDRLAIVPSDELPPLPEDEL
jgi:hypothetical protein